MSFSSIARFLREQVAGPSPEEQEREHHHRMRLATASVLLEIAYADDSFSISEKKDIVEYLRSRFDLDQDDARQLVESAEELRSETIDHFAMTNYIRQNSTIPERIEIVKEMWRLVYKDGNLHQYENYLVRKLAGLIGLEHHVMIEAKLAVQGEMDAERKPET
ncbi:MAG: TerB family tellurite resistance protein [Thermoanaerobaculia bacterium]